MSWSDVSGCPVVLYPFAGEACKLKEKENEWVTELVPLVCRETFCISCIYWFLASLRASNKWKWWEKMLNNSFLHSHCLNFITFLGQWYQSAFLTLQIFVITSENGHRMSLSTWSQWPNPWLGSLKQASDPGGISSEVFLPYLLHLILSVRNTSDCNPYNNLPSFFPPEWIHAIFFNSWYYLNRQSHWSFPLKGSY